MNLTLNLVPADFIDRATGAMAVKVTASGDDVCVVNLGPHLIVAPAAEMRSWLLGALRQLDNNHSTAAHYAGEAAKSAPLAPAYAALDNAGQLVDAAGLQPGDVVIGDPARCPERVVRRITTRTPTTIRVIYLGGLATEYHPTDRIRILTRPVDRSGAEACDRAEARMADPFTDDQPASATVSGRDVVAEAFGNDLDAQRAHLRDLSEQHRALRG
jgi:hypothetical protein